MHQPLRFLQLIDQPAVVAALNVDGPVVISQKIPILAKSIVLFTERFDSEKKLNKAVFKRCGLAAVVSVSQFEKLYKIDDELFFEYAVECDENGNPIKTDKPAEETDKPAEEKAE